MLGLGPHGRHNISEIVITSIVMDTKYGMCLERYPHQCRYVVVCEDYTWCIPAVDAGDTVFFITAYPDRQLHRRYTRR